MSEPSTPEGSWRPFVSHSLATFGAGTNGKHQTLGGKPGVAARSVHRFYTSRAMDSFGQRRQLCRMIFNWLMSL